MLETFLSGSPAHYFLLGAAAMLAGLVDAVVGGGGLIQTPALFSVLGSAAPATLLGTSKLGGILGTSAAAASFSRRVPIAWSVAAPAAMTAFIFSFCGALTVTRVPGDFFRKLLPFILAAAAFYIFHKKHLGAVHAPRHEGRRERWFAAASGAAVGFYDGFFGPGTGSFLVFAFVRFFGFDFLRAAATAKIVNVACNAAALLWFGYSGHLLWVVGAIMAACNICGSLLGSRLAMRFGSGFVRRLFLFVVGILIVKTGYDAFLQ